MLLRKITAPTFWMIGCMAVVIGLCGCDLRSESEKAQEKARQLAAECRDKEPGYERAKSCIAHAKLTKKTRLDLVNFGLEQLPPTLFELDGLTTLNLGNNHLSSLPGDIARLKRLVTLHLFNNKLESLPDAIAQLKELRWLTLSNNRFKNIPPDIFGLSQLRRLNMRGNNLIELPDRFDALAHLELVNLKNNQISSIPQTLMSLQELRRLFLDHNRFKTFDVLPGSLLALEQLSLAGNPIEQIGPGIASLGNLWNLVLDKDRYNALPEVIEPLKPFIFPCEIAYDESKPEEYQKRYELFLRYAQAGDYRAQDELGSLLVNSSKNGKYYDIEKGIEWTRKAAMASRNAHIQFGLAMWLQVARLGYSDEKKRSDTRKEAFKWLMAAAEQGHAYAQMEIAMYYFKGRGRKRDYVNAYTWFKLASDRFKAVPIMVKGKDISEKSLVSSFMTSIANSDKFTEEQKAMALSMAEKWEDDHPDAYKFWPYWACE